MNPTSSLFLLLVLTGQPASAGPDSKDEADARLATMRTLLAEYKVQSADNSAAIYRLKEEPVLRFTNSVGSTQDGAVFLWLGANGRPEATAQVSLRRDGVWFYELSSLSEQPLVATPSAGVPWQPARAGVEFKPMPGAPAPAGNPEQRLRQLRTLAAEFSAKDYFRNHDWQNLRMLRTPLARYGNPETTLIDGALFGYVLTTDPEVLLMIEARKGKSGPEWQFAFAPMTIYQVNGSWKGQEVWVGSGFGAAIRASDPSGPFYVRVKGTEP